MVWSLPRPPVHPVHWVDKKLGAVEPCFWKALAASLITNEQFIGDMPEPEVSQHFSGVGGPWDAFEKKRLR